jgi:hypothetical protein
MKEEIIYQITVEDLQEVANQELERKLTSEEIELVKEKIAERIPWYDAIADSISDTLK